MIRKGWNQKEIQTPKPEVGKVGNDQEMKWLNQKEIPTPKPKVGTSKLTIMYFYNEKYRVSSYFPISHSFTRT